MIIFGILRFPSEEVALSVRGRCKRLGHPRFACVKGMYFRRFARLSSEEYPLLLQMSQQRRERDQGHRKVEQEGICRRLCCAWTSQHKLHDSHVSVILPFEEPMI